MEAGCKRCPEFTAFAIDGDVTQCTACGQWWHTQRPKGEPLTTGPVDAHEVGQLALAVREV